MLRRNARTSPAIPLTLILASVALTGFLLASGCSSPGDSPSKSLANYQPAIPQSAASGSTVVQNQVAASATNATAERSDSFAGLAPQGMSGSLDGTIWESPCAKTKRANSHGNYRQTRVQFDRGRFKLTHAAWNDRECRTLRMATIELIGKGAVSYENAGLPDGSGTIRAHLEITQHELFLSFDATDLAQRANSDAVCGITNWTPLTYESIAGRNCPAQSSNGQSIGSDFIGAFLSQRNQVLPNGTVYSAREVTWPTPSQTIDAETQQVTQNDELEIAPLFAGVPPKAVSGTLKVYRSTWVKNTGTVPGSPASQQPLQIINPENDPFKPH
jgi:hypothetical protein